MRRGFTLSRYVAGKTLWNTAALFGALFILVVLVDFIELMRSNADLRPRQRGKQQTLESAYLQAGGVVPGRHRGSLRTEPRRYNIHVATRASVMSGGTGH